MAAMDFPSNPTDGQVYGSYVFDATAGVWKSREESAAVTVVSPTAPLSANPGDLWLNSNSNILFSYYSDGTSSQWVEVITSSIIDISDKASKSYVDSQDALKANLSGADFTGNISTTKITSTGGPEGIVLKAGSTLDHAYISMYADSQAQGTRSGWFGYGSVNNSNMSISNEMTNGNLSLLVNGTGQVNLPAKTYMPGAVVQVAEVRSAAGDKSASTSIVDIISTTFTTKLANSKLLLMWHSGQVSMSAPQVNMMIYFTIDGTDISDFTTNHYFYGDNNTGLFRHVVTIPVMSGALSLGAHTVKVRGQAYNGTATYDFQSSSSPERRSRLVIMEVAQ